MNPSPHLPFLSPLLLLLLLPTLPVQAWFNCVQGSLNSGAGRCLGNGPDFPLKFTCHLDGKCLEDGNGCTPDKDEFGKFGTEAWCSNPKP